MLKMTSLLRFTLILFALWTFTPVSSVAQSDSSPETSQPYFIDGEQTTFNEDPQESQLELLGKWNGPDENSGVDVHFTDPTTVVVTFKEFKMQAKGHWTLVAGQINMTLYGLNDKVPSVLQAGVKEQWIEIEEYGLLTKSN